MKTALEKHDLTTCLYELLKFLDRRHFEFHDVIQLPIFFFAYGGPFAARGRMVQNHHDGAQAARWDIPNDKNSTLTG